MIGQGWHVINGNWFYMYASGAMAADTWIGNSYVNSSGAWVQGKTKVQEGWVQSGSRWWYRHADGGYTRNSWEMIKGQWYFFDKDGWMVTGWRQIGGDWYYFQTSGAMVGEGWHVINGNWYYMYANGVMATNTWIGGYYVNSSGVWTDPNSKNYISEAQVIKYAENYFGRKNGEIVKAGSDVYEYVIWVADEPTEDFPYYYVLLQRYVNGDHFTRVGMIYVNARTGECTEADY